MLENSVSFFKLQKIFHIVLGGLFGLSVIFSFGIFIAYMITSDSPQPSIDLSMMEKKLGKQKGEKIDFGTLLGSREKISLPLPEIGDEIAFCPLEKRPDASDEDQRIVFVSKTLNLPFFAKPGLPIYLDYDPKNGALILTKDETPLSILPEVDPGGAMMAHFKLKLAGFSEERVFPLKGVGYELNLAVNEGFRKSVHPLHAAKCYPPDAIFKIYGGKQYAHFQNFYRLQIPSEEGTAMSFVAPNDLLIWDKKYWRKAEVGEDTRLYPIAHVAKILEQKMEMVAFDVGGEEFLRIPLFVSRPKMKIPNWGEVFVNPKIRSLHSISCRLGGKNMILREGDWLIQTSKGWHLLKSPEEFEAVLEYRTGGDLLILDKIEKQGGGAVLTGHYFDAMRSFSQKITLPIAERKKSVDSGKKKNRKSATMEGYGSNT